MQVAEGSFSHVAVIAAFAPSTPRRRICVLQGSFSGQDLTGVPCFKCKFHHVESEGLTALKFCFAADDKR